MNVVDLRGTLPFVGNIYGTYGPKESLTLHWNGGPVTGDPVQFLIADANYHISQGWGGISYHDAIGEDGTLYICRDPDAVLATVGNTIGNQTTRAVQLMLGTGQTVTPAMWATATEIALTAPMDIVYGHRDWSATQCPGDEIYDWIQRKGWLDMTPAQMQEIKDFISAKFSELYGVTEAVSRRQLRGHDPFSAGFDTPITAGEHVNPDHAV